VAETAPISLRHSCGSELHVFPPLLEALTITSKPHQALPAYWLPQGLHHSCNAGDNLRHVASVDTGSIQLALDDFPRYHPRTAARCRSGFTDISRYGLVDSLTRQGISLNILPKRCLGGGALATQPPCMSPCRWDHIFSSRELSGVWSLRILPTLSSLSC
jgi:hypothetical protein